MCLFLNILTKVHFVKQCKKTTDFCKKAGDFCKKAGEFCKTSRRNRSPFDFSILKMYIIQCGADCFVVYSSHTGNYLFEGTVIFS